MNVRSRKSEVGSQKSEVPNQGHHSTHAVRIRRGAIDAVVAHARRAAPSECCGLLVGSGSRIVDAVPAKNIADGRTRFLIDPKDHIDGRREARRRGLDVIGFYHSHPQSSAQPSATDRAEASYPDHLYLIVGLLSDPPDVRVFIPGADEFSAVTVIEE